MESSAGQPSQLVIATVAEMRQAIARLHEIEQRVEDLAQRQLADSAAIAPQYTVNKAGEVVNIYTEAPQTPGGGGSELLVVEGGKVKRLKPGLAGQVLNGLGEWVAAAGLKTFAGEVNLEWGVEGFNSKEAFVTDATTGFHSVYLLPKSYSVVVEAEVHELAIGVYPEKLGVMLKSNVKHAVGFSTSLRYVAIG